MYKKYIGIVFIAFGFAFLIFVLFNLFSDQGHIISPIPEDTGVKVLYISPSAQ